MRVLKILGWLFIPFVLIFVRWKHLNTFFRTIGICWSVLLLSILINNSPQENPVPSASAATTKEQPVHATAQTQPAKTTSTTSASETTKITSKQPPQATTLEQQKAQLDAEIQRAKKGTYQDQMKALKDYLTIDKTDLLAKHPEVQDMGFAGDLFVQTNKNSLKYYTSLGNGLVSQNANGIYWAIQVTLNNAGSNPIEVNTNMFTLTTADGRSFSTDVQAETMLSKPLIMDMLNPGVDDTGYLIFDVPETLSIKEVTLNVQNGFFHNVKLKIS